MLTGTCDDNTSTWENTGEPIMDTWCTPCHSASVTGEQRNGAPDEVDFDTLEDVRAWSHRILIQAALSDNMPPAGGLSTTERADLQEWIACGTPGAERTDITEIEISCDTLIWYFGALDDDVCRFANAIDADVTIEGQDYGCLCEVTGTLSVESTAVLPRLIHVGGDLIITGEAVEQVELSALQAIDGELLVHDTIQLQVLDLPRLETAGGYVVTGNSGLLEIRNTDALISVSGPVEVSQNDALTGLDGFKNLATAGSIAISGNETLVASQAFHNLVEITGNLIVADHPSLRELKSFPDLETLDGRLEISANPLLVDIDVIPWLRSVGALTVSGSPAIPPLTGLEAVDGDVRITANPGLVDLGGLGNLLTVGDDLVVQGNPNLTNISDLGAVTSVGGDLTLADNPTLPTNQADNIADALQGQIGGDVDTTGNAP